MPDIAFIIPVLDRPHRVAPLLSDLRCDDVNPYFVPSPDDGPELEALEEAEAAIIGPVDGNYATKINEAVREVDEPLLFFGADDLSPDPGWSLVAIEYMRRTGVQVVGVNDFLPRRREHATHFLVTREYAEQPCLDGSDGPLFTGYDHSFVDDEFIATACRRGEYAYCETAVVRHMHPHGRTAPDDATYRRGRARFHEDRKIFEERSRLWT